MKVKCIKTQLIPLILTVLNRSISQLLELLSSKTKTKNQSKAHDIIVRNHRLFVRLDLFQTKNYRGSHQVNALKKWN